MKSSPLNVFIPGALGDMLSVSCHDTHMLHFSLVLKNTFFETLCDLRVYKKCVSLYVSDIFRGTKEMEKQIDVSSNRVTFESSQSPLWRVSLPVWLRDAAIIRPNQDSCVSLNSQFPLSLSPFVCHSLIRSLYEGGYMTARYGNWY